MLLAQCLDVNNVMLLWALLLAEQKVVLQGKQPHVLTMAAETLSALLFPFSWQHVYIPILPARLLDILQAPVPFLIGIDEFVLGMAERQGMIPNDVSAAPRPSPLAPRPSPLAPRPSLLTAARTRRRTAGG